METDILVKKAKNGDRDALVRLIMNQKKDYYKLAYAYLENREDALDGMEDMIVILNELEERLIGALEGKRQAVKSASWQELQPHA